MKVVHVDNNTYRVPNALSDFQLKMYVHLINWKWNHLTTEPGYSRGIPYDAILPTESKDRLLPIHESIANRVRVHRKRFPFKLHKFIGHMASSQAACINLFVPPLLHPSHAAKVFRAVKPDLHRIATTMLDEGFRIEFWDEPDNALNDHNPVSGTDADIAIAYYTDDNELRLWLIEHKLTEPDFTTCGGYRSPGRNKQTHRCDSVNQILQDRRTCYYDTVSKYRYWEITQDSPEAFPTESLLRFKGCPFQGGLNQLWRNQLLALSIEKSQSDRWPYKQVYFSVVYHPDNSALEPKIDSYKEMLGPGGRFSSFTSDKVLSEAAQAGAQSLNDWIEWYSDMYLP